MAHMKKIAHLLLGRFSIVALTIILQFVWLVLVMYRFSYQFTYANLAIRLIAVILVLVIVNKWTNPANKLSWTFIILFSPMVGLMLYTTFGRSELTKKTERRLDMIVKEVGAYFYQTPEIKEDLEQKDKAVLGQSKYINDWGGYPIYRNTQTKYYRSGEEMFPDMLKELEKAEHFIFLEYFIIEEGYMFDTMTEILARKAAEGVDVRVIYDDIGCISTLPPKYNKKLESMGIKCAVFNPFRPIMSVVMNNRDHRKIFVVDGKVGFTGGINLADEYINEKSRFGYWKDTGVRLEGEAVWNLTAMFLTAWSYVNHSREDYKEYMPQIYQTELPETDGYVQPYGDSPLDHETVGENIYLNMINDAENYVYIFTPYLIIDNEMLVSLCNAAKRGVDVRIVTPGIPDKKLIFLLTQSHYEPLLRAGVKIYQYTPGFIHAKSFLCDDKVGTVGSINLDYRSLYLHFECGVFMYRTKALEQLKQDCLDTFEQSEEMTLEFCKNQNVFIRILQGMMRLVAPLL